MLKKGKIPHTFVIIFFIIVIGAVLTWFIPGGEYEREIIVDSGVEREVVKNGSFEYTKSDPQTWQIFSAFYHGFISKSNIIAFILMVGGAFWIMNKSRAIDVGIFSFLRFTRRLESSRFIKLLGVDNIVVVLIMLMFSLFGAVFGMSEETIAFVIIFVPLSISMGYDSIVGVSMCFVAAGLGFAGAILNPFTVGIAQGLADIPLFSGIEYRFFCWMVLNVVGIAFVLRYMKRLRKDPTRSPVYEEDEQWRKSNENGDEKIEYHRPLSAWIVYLIILGALVIFSLKYSMTTLEVGRNAFSLPVIPVLTGLYAFTSLVSLRKSVHFFILNLLVYTIIFVIVGVMGYDWYIMKIATIFLAMGILSGIAFNEPGNNIAELFLKGVRDIMGAAIVVGLAGGIVFLLEEGNIIDTLLHYMAEGMKDVGKVGSVGVMYVFQTLLNIMMPSGSGQAALTMPIMAPFSDLIGISRQTAVLVFQFGDGFTNMITPTSGVLMGVLGMAKIPYDKWFRWFIPFLGILVTVGILLLIPTVLMDIAGF
ncbi:MAG: YfcC family protein [Bacteroidales bacterium]|nr:YfcC family protein [Bacteroidales bacterium]